MTKYGFTDDLGPIVYGTADHEVFLGRDLNNSRNYSETIATEIDREIRKLIDHAYDSCRTILSTHEDQLQLVAEYLIQKEKVDDKEFVKLMTGKITMDDIAQMSQTKEVVETENVEKDAHEQLSDVAPNNTSDNSSDAPLE